MLASSLFTDNTDGSDIIALVNNLRADVQRVEEKVDAVNEGMGALAKRLSSEISHDAVVRGA